MNKGNEEQHMYVSAYATPSNFRHVLKCSTGIGPTFATSRPTGVGKLGPVAISQLQKRQV